MGCIQNFLACFVFIVINNVTNNGINNVINNGTNNVINNGTNNATNIVINNGTNNVEISVYPCTSIHHPMLNQLIFFLYLFLSLDV